MIELKSVNKNYGSLNVINDISFTVEKGEFVSLVGRSGSGKSTILNMIGAIDTVSSGSILVNGLDISAADDKTLCRYRNHNIGFIFQSFYLEPAYSVYKNVEIPLIVAGDTRDRAEKINNALDKVGMLSRSKEQTSKLSGGEQQRVCIARAIVNDPDIILADEPCGNLDSKNGEMILSLLKELSAMGKTVILVTHSMVDAAKTDRILTLHDGKIIVDKKDTVCSDL